MSKEEGVFTRRALTVYSTLVTLLTVASIGWFAASAINSIRDEARKAISEVRNEVQTLQLSQTQHEAKDDARDVAITQRIDRVESFIDGRMGRVTYGPPQPPIPLRGP